MRRCWSTVGALAVGFALALLCTQSQAKPSKNKRRRSTRGAVVTVVDVAAGRAYLKIRGKQKLQKGDTVSIRGRRYSVVAHNAQFAVIEYGKRIPRRGQRGRAIPSRRSVEPKAKRYAEPTPLAKFDGLWGAPRLPAVDQHPEYVALGRVAVRKSSYARLSVDYVLLSPLGGDAVSIGRTRIRGALHWRPSHGLFQLDADGFVEKWHASDLAYRPQNRSRPIYNLRQLQLRYPGQTVDGSVGRLRYASSTLGMLDGVRVATAVGENWSVAAFGGMVPDVETSAFQGDVSRFGVEAVWQGGERNQSRGSLAWQGSMFDGELDERRMVLDFETFPGDGRMSGYAEVAFFDEDNPWGASPVEITVAGGDGSWKVTDALSLGLSASMRRPERSRWLAEVLPSTFFCVAEPVAGEDSAEFCQGGDQRLAATANASLRRPGWTVRTSLTGATTVGSDAEQLSGLLHARLPDVGEAVDLQFGVSGFKGTLGERAAIDLAASRRWLNNALELEAYYRPATARYRASSQSYVEHGGGAKLYWAPASSVDLSLSTDVLAGSNASVFTLFAGLSFRPRF